MVPDDQSQLGQDGNEPDDAQQPRQSRDCCETARRGQQREGYDDEVEDVPAIAEERLWSRPVRDEPKRELEPRIC